MGTTHNDFYISLQTLTELNKQLTLFQTNCNNINDNCLFLNMQDVINITGWSKKTVELLFNHPDFPCTDIGKKKLVLKTAFMKFFSTRRCKDDEVYWRYVSQNK